MQLQDYNFKKGLKTCKDQTDPLNYWFIFMNQQQDMTRPALLTYTYKCQVKTKGVKCGKWLKKMDQNSKMVRII